MCRRPCGEHALTDNPSAWISELPAEVPLNGADWFLYLMDWRMRRRLGGGCVCHLIVELAAATPVDLAERLAANPRWVWMTSLRVRAMPPLRRPAWVATRAAWEGLVALGAHDDTDALLRVLQGRMDVERDAPVRFSVGHVGGRPVAVLSWHHALIDARGAERLMAELGGHARAARSSLPAVVLTPMQRMWSAKQARDFIYEVSTGAVAWIDRRQGGQPIDHFLRVSLDGDELAQVDQQAERVGAALVRSALHVAAATRAVAHLLNDRGVLSGDLLIPAPQEQRTARAEVGNGLSLLFYRVPRAAASDLQGLVQHAITQVRGMLRSGLPAAMTTLLDLCVWLPAWFYGPIVSFPTRGRLATLGVSDTGGSLGGLVLWQGVKVEDAWHVPANLHPPGLTLVFTRFRGRQDIVIRWRDDLLSAEEIKRLVARMRADLLGVPEAAGD